MRWSDHSLGVILALCLVAPAAELRASRAEASQASASDAPLDTLTVGRVAFSRMHMLLEKTIFQVDVLTVDVRLGDEDARRIAQLAARMPDSRELEDSIASVAIRSRDAWIKIQFIRNNVSLDQFIDGIDDNLRHVPSEGIISRSDYEEILGNLPRWFGFLEERRIRRGDQIHYRILGDSLRTVFRAVSGEILLDQTDPGQVPRLAVLGSYFVRKSDFRKKLIESLFE